jgi:hypothetical protein
MRRREFIVIFGGAAARPLAARARHPPRLGSLRTHHELDDRADARRTDFPLARADEVIE